MLVCILFLMILCHIIDDFVLQSACLSNLKQKSWWENNVLNKSSSYRKLYKNDYKMALFIHSLSWSIMIHIPLMIFFSIFDIDLLFTLSILINTSIHYIIDDLKANKYKINLITDQIIHFIQIIVTFIIFILV